MRISTAWAQQLNINTMSSQQAKLAKLEQQLGTGLKLTEPADNPGAAANILDLNKSIAKTTQYQSNVSTAQGRLNFEESALATAGDILARAKDLTVQAMNASLNSSDRVAIKDEIDQLLQQMVGLANTQNANGEYIFSGDLSTVPAFAKDAATGNYVYQGGQGQRSLQIGPTREVADGDIGLTVFQNVKSASPAADENGNRSIFSTLQALSDALGGTFNATPAAVTGDRLLRYGLDYSAATTQFDLVANGGAVTASIDLSGKKFTDLNGLVTEINTQLTASGASGDIRAQSNGNRIEFVSVATGSAADIKINNTSGTFLGDAGFTNGQSKAGANAQTFQAQLGDVLSDLDAGKNSILAARTNVGARLNALTDQGNQNDKFILDTKTVLSQAQDLDYADAIGKFQMQSVALQAAQQAYGKVKQLSLFNYL
ncbi:MAG: flagellar hook-associated protein FlgL [Methylobacter sp.]